VQENIILKSHLYWTDISQETKLCMLIYHLLHPSILKAKEFLAVSFYIIVWLCFYKLWF